MPIGEIEVTSTQYAIAVDVDDMLHILKNEGWFKVDRLHEHLSKIAGVEEVDYNGHFGAYIFLTISTDCDNEETWKKIKEIINEAIDRS